MPTIAFFLNGLAVLDPGRLRCRAFNGSLRGAIAKYLAYLTTVLRGLPSGAALILEVGDDEKFSSRTMVDAPDSGEKLNEQLLDGQQRLTALWRSLRDKYEDRTYLVGFEEDPGNGKAKLPYVFGQARWSKNGKGVDLIFTMVSTTYRHTIAGM